MAPLCADPRQIVISLDEQRRLELLRLVDDVLLYMTSQQQAKVDELGNLSAESSDEENEGTKEIEEKTDELHIEPGPGDGSQSQTPTHATQEAKTPKTGGFSGATLMKSVKSVKIPNPWKKTSDAPSKATRKAEEIQLGALKYMVEWQQEFMQKFEEIARVQDNEKIAAERRARLEALETEKQRNKEPEAQVEQSDKTPDAAHVLEALQQFYLPMPTSLTKLLRRDRKECISCILLLLLSTGKYSAHSRTMILYLASSLNLPESFVDGEECEITQSLIESSTADQSQKENMSADAEAAKRQNENKFSRMWKVGLASVAGATIIGVTGGLAAPLVAGAMGSILGGVGLGGVASFLGIFWMNGALVGALFGAYGAKMTGSMMDKYAKEVEDFRFIPLEEEKSQEGTSEKTTQDNKSRRLRVTIGVNGWLNSEEDITKPWHTLSADSEVFALRYEMKTLLALGTALKDLVQSFAWKALKAEIIKRTVLATLFAALWPIQVLSLASNVDNPFSHASNRSKKAGRLLADALINKVQGERPVTLIGYSLGAVAIHSCLQSLAERQAFGLIDTVVIIGAPAPSDPAHWRTLRTVVSGKIFNVYSENDMVLGFVYRMHSLAMGVAGLQAIEGVAEVHNLNLSEKVSGHLRYPEIIGEILRNCGFTGIEAGGEIEKDEVMKMKQDYEDGKQIEDLPLDADEKQKLVASESDEQGHRINMVGHEDDMHEISSEDRKDDHDATNSTAFI